MINHTERIEQLLIDDDLNADLRNMLIALDRDDDDEILASCDSPATRDLADMLETLHAMRTADLARLRLAYSLCPIHAIDFAICFDDDDPDCAQIRSIFPDEHDT